MFAFLQILDEALSHNPHAVRLFLAAVSVYILLVSMPDSLYGIGGKFWDVFNKTFCSMKFVSLYAVFEEVNVLKTT